MSVSNQTVPNYSYRVGPSSRHHTQSLSPHPTSSLPSPPPSPPPSSAPSTVQSSPAPVCYSPCSEHSSSPTGSMEDSQHIPSQQEDAARTIPAPLLTLGSEEPSSSLRVVNTEPQEGDQCIFLRYYKMKRRKILPGSYPLKAAAGPDQLPPPGPDSQGADPIAVCTGSWHDRHEFETVPGMQRVRFTSLHPHHGFSGPHSYSTAI